MRAVADPIVRLAIAVTEAPWTVTRMLDAPLQEHVVLQASLFGHLNRIADAVDVPADYPDSFGAPHVEPATPPYAVAPEAIARDPRITLPNVGEALAAWRAHAFDRDAPLTRNERAVIRGVAARSLGEALAMPAPSTPREHALATLAETVTRAPWRLNPATYAPLYALGLDDAAVFDAVATASAAAMFARTAVALSQSTQVIT